MSKLKQQEDGTKFFWFTLTTHLVVSSFALGVAFIFLVFPGKANLAQKEWLALLILFVLGSCLFALGVLPTEKKKKTP